MPKPHYRHGVPADGLLYQELRRLMRYEPATGNFVRTIDHRSGRAGDIAGSSHHDGRVFIGLLGLRFAAHRLAVLWMTGRMPHEEVDHINCNHSDNRWENLRECTSSQNKCNRRSGGNQSGGFKGVRLNKRSGTYEARIKANRKTIHVGTFKTIEEACDALNKVRSEVHGDFSRP